MANPFATFRKNQTMWMAATVLLAILAFIVAPAIQQMSSAFRGPTGDDAVVVSWDGGQITVADLRNNTMQHGNLVRFLRDLGDKVIENGGMPNVPGFQYNATSGILSTGINENSSDAAICQSRILADYAERMGVVFDDAAVQDYIEAFCDRSITDSSLQNILRESTGGRLSAFELRELLKQELTVLVANRLAMAGTGTQTPGKTFRNFARINRTANIEAFPVIVEDYLKDVTSDPTETDLTSIYEEGKARPADPDSPLPGFGRSYQVNIEYLEADRQAWIDREKAKLTDEELKAEYDRQIDLGLLQVAVTPEETASDEIPTSESEAEVNTEPGAADEQDTTPDVDSATTAPASDGAIEEPDATDEQGSAANNRTRFVSFVQDEETGESTEATDSETTVPNSVDDGTSAQPSAAVSGDGRLPPVVQPPQLGEADTTLPAAPEMRTKTFEEAREELANKLAEERAMPAITEAMERVYADHMKPYSDAYRKYQSFKQAEIEGDMEEPVRPDLKKLAAEYGLTHNETNLIDYFQLSPELRQAMVTTEGYSQPGGRPYSIAQIMMNPQFNEFLPLQGDYFDFSQMTSMRIIKYLCWKTESKDAYIPELDEVRDEVVAAWKIDQARTKAKESAQAVANKVGDGEDPWASAVGTTEQALVVKDVPPFTWLTSFGQGVNLSPVQKLDLVGDEFMQHVFSSTPGKTVVAPNNAKSKYYVVRVVDFSPTDEELHARFENSGWQSSGPMQVAQQEFSNSLMGWQEAVFQEMDVQWSGTDAPN